MSDTRQLTMPWPSSGDGISKEEGAMSASEPDWADSIRPIMGVIGEEATLRLIDHTGGLDIYIPTRPPPTHQLAALLGQSAFEALCHAFGGRRLYLPLTAFRDLKKQVVIALAGKGMTNREIARRARCTERYVGRVLHDLR